MVKENESIKKFTDDISMVNESVKNLRIIYYLDKFLYYSIFDFDKSENEEHNNNPKID